MAALKEIRARIETTKNTQQITKAMKLVSAAKLRKAQHQIVNMRPYAHTLLKIIADIAATQRVSHPLMTPHAEVKRVLVVVLTSDRGLCGGFNSQIHKFTDQWIKNNSFQFSKVDFMFIGRRASDYFARKGVRSIETILKLDKDVSYDLASKLAERMMKNYLSGAYDEVKLIYNEFKSAISQRPVIETLLPVDLSKQSFSAQDAKVAGFSLDMIFEPKPEQIIDQMLVKHFSVQVYRCMCESVAAEHGARMTAMENATNNAREVVSKLTLSYNKLRQEKITTELTEIVSGAEALK
ncbi:MAG: ATP synthase F1 subunit gamma [Pseudobdellovibrionaceae bacterium]|jgi:F-type H+-transporting ATPase subunit gamma